MSQQIDKGIFNLVGARKKLFSGFNSARLKCAPKKISKSVLMPVGNDQQRPGAKLTNISKQ